MLALRGEIALAEAIARAQGWRFRIAKPENSPDPDPPPWTILSFEPGHGLLSRLFVIAYHEDVPWAPPYAQPLYARGPATGGARLGAVWLASTHFDADQEVLSALGGGAGG